MKILPMLSRGEVFLHSDGTVTLEPMQVIRRPDGSFVLRFGKNTYWFDKDGHYTGSEHKATDMSQETHRRILEALQTSTDFRDQAPDEPYFGDRDGTVQTLEQQAWPKRSGSN